MSYGPWKLCGLPGLILAAEDSDGANKFEAIILRNGASAITPVSDKNITTTTREKFVKAKNMFESDPMGNLPPESISEMSIHKYDERQQIFTSTVSSCACVPTGMFRLN